MCITESLCCIAEINIVNQPNFNKINLLKIKIKAPLLEISHLDTKFSSAACRSKYTIK